MREYSLQDSEYRKTVDLRNYRTLIENAIHSVTPSTEVNVEKDHYTLSPLPSKGELIMIGRVLAKPENLGRYCITRPVLFKGETVKTEKVSEDINESTIIEQANKDNTKKKGRPR